MDPKIQIMAVLQGINSVVELTKFCTPQNCCLPDQKMLILGGKWHCNQPHLRSKRHMGTSRHVPCSKQAAVQLVLSIYRPSFFYPTLVAGEGHGFRVVWAHDDLDGFTNFGNEVDRCLLTSTCIHWCSCEHAPIIFGKHP